MTSICFLMEPDEFGQIGWSRRKIYLMGMTFVFLRRKLWFLIIVHKQQQNPGGIVIFVLVILLSKVTGTVFSTIMAIHDFVRVLGRLNNVRQSSRFVPMKMQKMLIGLEKPANLDEPIKYSQTKASKMDVYDTFRMKPNPAVLYIERHVILVTTIVLLIYFAFLRKENKFDRILDGSYKYVEDDEIKILNALLLAKLRGLKTDDLERKLQLIRHNNKG